MFVSHSFVFISQMTLLFSLICLCKVKLLLVFSFGSKTISKLMDFLPISSLNLFKLIKKEGDYERLPVVYTKNKLKEKWKINRIHNSFFYLENKNNLNYLIILKGRMKRKILLIKGILNPNKPKNIFSLDNLG